jgi:hypothetical protein
MPKTEEEKVEYRAEMRVLRSDDDIRNEAKFTRSTFASFAIEHGLADERTVAAFDAAKRADDDLKKFAAARDEALRAEAQEQVCLVQREQLDLAREEGRAEIRVTLDATARAWREEAEARSAVRQIERETPSELERACAWLDERYPNINTRFVALLYARMEEEYARDRTADRILATARALGWTS